MLLYSGGNYIERQVNRCAQMSGAFGKTLDKVMTMSGLGQLARRHDEPTCLHVQEDLPRFLQEYRPHNLCGYIPNRQHQGFQYDRHVPGADMLGYKQNTLSSRLDRWARVAHND